MRKTQRGRRISRKKTRLRKTKRRTNSVFFLFILMVLFVISTGASYIYFKPIFAYKSSLIEEIEARRLQTKEGVEKEGTHRLYKSDEHAASVWYNAEFRKDAIIATIENVIRRYIKPYGARLLDLYMDREGIIYIDLSSGIRKNFKGDAFEEYSIIAGLYKSIRASIPDFKALKILIDSKEAESFGGHIDISRPIGEEIAGSTENI